MTASQVVWYRFVVIFFIYPFSFFQAKKISFWKKVYLLRPFLFEMKLHHGASMWWADTTKRNWLLWKNFNYFFTIGKIFADLHSIFFKSGTCILGGVKWEGFFAEEESCTDSHYNHNWRGEKKRRDDKTWKVHHHVTLTHPDPSWNELFGRSHSRAVLCPLVDDKVRLNINFTHSLLVYTRHMHFPKTAI